MSGSSLQPDTLRTDGQLLLTAAIWGLAFTAQRAGMEFIGPFTYNGVRFALGTLSLLPLLLMTPNPARPGRRFSPTLLNHGLVAGLLLFGGSSLQQVALQYTTAGKAGFITGLYVVLVPIFGHFLGTRSDRGRWIGAVLAMGGLYFLSITEQFTIARGDGMVMLCAFFFAAHVLYISYAAPKLPALPLSMVQYAVCALGSATMALFTETATLAAIGSAWLPILYGGLFSVGVAYSLQVHAQQRAHPAHAAIILSLEGLFAAVGGFLILGELLSPRNLFGALLMILAMLAAQWGQISALRRKTTAREASQ
ncbi:MAG: DMT family transporter [Spirochaetaceae bacterium]